MKEQTKREVCDIFYFTIELMNLPGFIMNLIEDLNMLKFSWSLNSLLLWRRSSVISLSNWFKIFLSAHCNSWKRVFRISVKQWQCRKKWGADSTSKLQEYKGFTQSSKLWLNFSSFRWLSRSLNLVSNFKTLGLCIL